MPALDADPLPQLSVAGARIVDPAGAEVRLRGFGVGGWMNLENFINGFPGVEHRLRSKVASVLGATRADLFFDRWADHFLSEADIKFAASLGANVLRLAVNYRHFESDDSPFSYREEGFERLRRALDLCGRNGLYAIIDLHSAPGWQNPDWHCDNMSRTALLWSHPHFAERTGRLWSELAARFHDHPALGGYDLLNEPATNTPYERDDYTSLNVLYSRLVKAVRDVDPRHLIFLEGNMFGSRFEQLDIPDTHNVVWSFHDYGPAQVGPGPYPGMYRDRWIDADVLAEVIHGLPGPRFAARHGVPLWVGEFGAVFAGPPEETDDRLRALDDQIAVFESAGWSWTAWTLKDIGAMGVLSIQPDSSYAALSEIAASLKSACLADKWATWEPQGPVAAAVGALASALSSVGVAPFEQLVDELGGRVGSDYAADLLQEQFVAELGRLDDDALEQAAASFAFDVCCVRKPYADLLAERFAAGRRDG
jgi:aryl-phospho-beta-D-glucosidase BglC (GH1 family)